MPPSSRKRNKGSDRKAKKEEIQRAKVRKIWLGFTTLNGTIDCEHGCTLPDDFDPSVSKFMDDSYLQITASDDSNAGMEVLRKKFYTHPQIWNDTNNREMVSNILVRIGTNMMIIQHSNANKLEWGVPTIVAEVILTLQEYGETMNINLAFNSQRVTSRRLLLNSMGSSIRRDLLKFYRKRTSCSCLKKMHLYARETIPKMGFCFGCGKEKERASLSICSRCMVGVGYCSRQCQVANWPKHRPHCNNCLFFR